MAKKNKKHTGYKNDSGEETDYDKYEEGVQYEKEDQLFQYPESNYSNMPPGYYSQDFNNSNYEFPYGQTYPSMYSYKGSSYLNHQPCQSENVGMAKKKTKEKDPFTEESEEKISPPVKKLGGKKKVNLRYIESKNKRGVTFSKRKKGIMKKAYELNVLTGTQILLLVASESGHVYTFATPKLRPIISDHEHLIQQCLNAPTESGDKGEEYFPEYDCFSREVPAVNEYEEKNVKSKDFYNFKK